MSVLLALDIVLYHAYIRQEINVAYCTAPPGQVPGSGLDG